MGNANEQANDNPEHQPQRLKERRAILLLNSGLNGSVA
jgi:hypothetical protein